MNYLGHALLSFGNADILTGNLIGDHVKGRIALEQYPDGIRKGLELHRKIDAFTDTHPAVLRAKIWFRPVYGLFAGAILDTIFDHYLANDARHFPSENALLQFTEQVYTQVAAREAYFPEAFARYFPYMRTQNWLYNSRTLQGINKALSGLERKAGEHMPPVEEAKKLLLIHYYELNQCYYELIDDAVKYVKTELNA